MASAVGKIDETVKEYLLYRGLIATSRQLETELKNEKEKKFRVDKIMDALHVHINSYDLSSLRDQWQFLDQRLFSRLDQNYAPSIRKLETSLLKLYVVNAVQNNKNDKVTEFFEKMTPELQGQTEWREWFMLPFIKNPDDNRSYAMYFTRQWQDTLFLTLHNFLSVIIRSMPLPPAFEYEEDARKVAKLQEENAKLRQMLADCRERRAMPVSVSEDSLVSTPVGPPPPPSALDLMDDFSVISQDSPITQKSNVNPPRTQQLKSFIKNIGSSPIMGRKAVPTPPGKNASNISGSQASAPTNQSKASGSNKSSSNSGAKGMGTSGGSSSLALKKDDRQKPKVVDGQSRGRSTAGFVVANPQPSQSSTVMSSSMGKLDTQEDRTAGTDSMGSTGASDMEPASAEICEDDNPPVLLSQEEYSEHRSCITHCRFNDTGQKVATADVDGVVKVWSVQPSPVTQATTMSQVSILSMDWTRQDRLLLGSKGGLVRLYDVKERKTVKEASMDVSYPRVVSLTSSPQGAQFVCSAVGRSRPPGMGSNTDISTLRIGRLAVWDLKTMKIERGLSVVPNSAAVNWTRYNHNGQMIISGGSDGHIRLYDTRKFDCLSSWTAHSGEVYTVAFSPDQMSCYSMGADGKFMHWSIHKMGHLLSSLPIHQGACGPFVHTGHGGYRQVQTPKGKLFALDGDGKRVVTCAQTGAQIYKLNGEALTQVKRSLFLGGHRTPVVAVDWSPSAENRMCVAGSMDGKLRISTLLVQ